MSMQLNFDATQVAPSTFEPLPEGQYEVMITDSCQKATKAGNGHYLQVTLEVQTGEHKGRLLWDRCVLDHPNKTTVEIARSSLSALCRAVDVLTPQDSAELHYKPCVARVALKKMQDGTPVNEIKGYSKVPPATAAEPTPMVKPSAAETVAPW